MAHEENFPYGKSFRIGIVDRKIEQNVVVDTPIGSFEQYMVYSFRDTMSITKFLKEYDEKMEELIKNNQIVLIGSYGLVQLPVNRIVERDRKVIVLEVNNSEESKYGSYEYSFRGNTIESVTGDGETLQFYTGDRYTFVKKEVEDYESRERFVSYNVLYPDSNAKGVDSKLYTGYNFFELFSKSVQLEEDEDGLVKRIESVYTMPNGNLFRHEEYVENGKENEENKDEEDDENFEQKEQRLTKVNDSYDFEADLHPVYNFSVFYPELKRAFPSLPSPPISKSEMKSLLSRLDTNIHRPRRGSTHKLGGPIMDRNLTHLVGSYITKPTEYITSSDEENQINE